MRYLLMHKLDEAVPGNFEPSPEFMTRMGAYMEEVVKAGILVAAEGLCKSSEESARITAIKGKKTVTDGPFTEAKEAIVSFALVEVRSKEEAIELCRRFWKIVGDGEGDIQQVFGPED